MSALLTEGELTYKDCMESEDRSKWTRVIQEEKDYLIKNQTWDLVSEEAQGKEIIISRWLLKIKEYGYYESRLVGGC